jgi:hypothetical protein
MTNYLENIELLKQLEPILERLGVEEDGYVPFFILSTDFETGKESSFIEKPFVLVKEIFAEKDGLVTIEPIFGQKYCKLQKLCQDTAKPFFQIQKTYRSDTLENVLPEWCFSVDTRNSFLMEALSIKQIQDGLLIEIHDLANLFQVTRGQPKLEALAKLVILLDGKGLLEEKE